MKTLDNPDIIRDCYFTEPVTVNSYGIVPGRGFWRRLSAAWAIMRGRGVGRPLMITYCRFEALPASGDPWLTDRQEDFRRREGVSEVNFGPIRITGLLDELPLGQEIWRNAPS